MQPSYPVQSHLSIIHHAACGNVPRHVISKSLTTLIRCERALTLIYERNCNGETRERDEAREMSLRADASDAARALGYCGVRFNRDPRGAAINLKRDMSDDIGLSVY